MSDIDPSTLRPIEETAAEESAKKDESNTKKARLSDLNNSEAARVIAEMVEDELIKLFEKFVRTDAAGGVCLNILDRIRGKTIDAKQAARALAERHNLKP